MDLQLFVAINVIAVSALAFILAVMQRPRGFLSWAVVNLMVLGVAALSLAYAADWAGLVAAGTFIPFVLAPAMFSQIAQRRANMGRYAEAVRFSRLAAILHPTPDSRFTAALATALARSEECEDVAPLQELMRRATPDQRAVIEAMMARSRGRWDEVIDIARRSPGARRDLASMEIRALGESGRVDEMIRLFEHTKASLSGYYLLFSQLFVLAFSGRPEAVGHMLAGQVKSLDPEAKAYWLALSQLCSPSAAPAGRASMASIAARSSRATIRHAAERHLAMAEHANGPPLSPEALRIVAATEAQVMRAARLAGLRTRHVPATLALIALNGLAFAAEVASGGSENTDVLVDLGALWPPLVFDAGEWWRLLSPAFLHFGALHLAANMLMLFLLGRLVEGTIGWRAVIAGYLVGAVGSTGAVLALMRAGIIPYGVLVGASGAIFALFGMIVARSIVDWRRSRDILDRRRLLSLAVVMAVQFAIDVSVPQISLAAHLSGFVIGLALGLGWLARNDAEP